MKLKVAIFSGTYPDTTFLTLLSRKLVGNDMEVHIYGKLVEKHKEDKGIKFFTYHSENKLSAIWFFFKYFFLNVFFNFRNTILFFKSIKNKSFYIKFTRALVVLPMMYHKPDIIHLQWL